MRKNRKGFTLMEMLIVVAIIAVLVAIGIPVLSAQLEKAREAVDLANIRSAYAVMQTAILTETAPDGNPVAKNYPFYIYTASGSFKPHTNDVRVDNTEVYKLKSKSANISQFVNMQWSQPSEETGWKDYIIVIYYQDVSEVPIMYVCPATWIP